MYTVVVPLFVMVRDDVEEKTNVKKIFHGDFTREIRKKNQRKIEMIKERAKSNFISTVEQWMGLEIGQSFKIKDRGSLEKKEKKKHT